MRSRFRSLSTSSLTTVDLTIESLEESLWRLFRVRLVTKAEDRRLVEAGLRFKMPEDWNGEDPWARYRAVEIKLPRGYPKRRDRPLG